MAHSLTIATLSGLLLLVACGPEAPPTQSGAATQVVEHDAASASDLLPASAGNAWTYERLQTFVNEEGQAAQRTSDTTMKVESVDTTADGIEVRLLSTVSEEPGSVEALLVIREDGIYQRGYRQVGPDGSSGSGDYSPMLPVLKWPSEAGRVITWEGTGFQPTAGRVGPMTVRIEDRGLVEVDTPAGRMKAYRVDALRTYTQDGRTIQSRQLLWVSPQIGIVRVVETTTAGAGGMQGELKLKSFTVK